MPLKGRADVSEYDFNSRFAGRLEVPPGLPRLSFDFREIFIGALVEQYDALQIAMRIAHREKTVVVSQMFFHRRSSSQAWRSRH